MKNVILPKCFFLMWLVLINVSFISLDMIDENKELTEIKIEKDISKIGYFDYIDNSLMGIFKFYQLYIADIDDQTCPMHPTCSNYGIEAVKKFGFLVGSLKIFDRLHRCSHDLQYYELVITKDRNSYKDLP